MEKNDKPIEIRLLEIQKQKNKELMERIVVLEETIKYQMSLIEYITSESIVKSNIN